MCEVHTPNFCCRLLHWNAVLAISEVFSYLAAKIEAGIKSTWIRKVAQPSFLKGRQKRIRVVTPSQQCSSTLLSASCFPDLLEPLVLGKHGTGYLGVWTWSTASLLWVQSIELEWLKVVRLQIWSLRAKAVQGQNWKQHTGAFRFLYQALLKVGVRTLVLNGGAREAVWRPFGGLGGGGCSCKSVWVSETWDCLKSWQEKVPRCIFQYQ